MEDYHKKLEPYYKEFDSYMHSFICTECCEDVNSKFASNKSKFIFVKIVDKCELWCCNDCKTELEVIKIH